ncbi:acyl carrier protein [Streptomyces sp. NPDC048387]|uniref:acyl carrier protein n=1 Tax=Streptomyces sp. NPDC048387 TaxID=3365542 RepID=UPI003721F506
MKDRTEMPDITDWLTGHLAALLDVPAADIDTTVPLDALGVTSMEEVALTVALEEQCGLTIPLIEVRRHPSVESLCAHLNGLVAQHPTEAPSSTGEGEA